MTMRWIEFLRNAEPKSIENKKYYLEQYYMNEENMTFEEAKEIKSLIEKKCK